MSVVTVSREYGTGGREFGIALANELGFKYADKEIAHELAGKMDMNEGYVEHFLDTGIPVGMSSGGSSDGFSYSPQETQRNVNLQIESHKLLRELATDNNIVIVGRASDIILKDFDPFRIFIYADAFAKLSHCKDSLPEGRNLSDKDLQREMQMIDNERYQHHALFSQIRWGDKLGYDLCINASEVDIQKVVPAVAAYIRIAQGIS